MSPRVMAPLERFKSDMQGNIVEIVKLKKVFVVWIDQRFGLKYLFSSKSLFDYHVISLCNLFQVLSLFLIDIIDEPQGLMTDALWTHCKHSIAEKLILNVRRAEKTQRALREIYEEGKWTLLGAWARNDDRLKCERALGTVYTVQKLMWICTVNFSR